MCLRVTLHVSLSVYVSRCRYTHLVLLLVLLRSASQWQSSAGLRTQSRLRPTSDAHLRRHRRLDLEHRVGHDLRTTLA